MGFDIWWSLHRARALDEAERAAVAAHVMRWRNVIAGYELMVPRAVAAPGDDGAAEEDGGPDGVGDVIAWSALRPSHGDPARSDHGGYLLPVIDEVQAALTELRQLVPDVELALADDFGTYGWDGEGWEPFDGDAREPAMVDERAAWVEAGDARAAPQPLPAGAAALCAPTGDEAAIARAVQVCERHGSPAWRAACVDALAARLALDGWEPRPWTAAVLGAIAGQGGRSGWRSVALAVDAGLPGAAASLARVLDTHAGRALAEDGAWSALLVVLGHREQVRGEATGVVAAVAPVAGALNAVREALRSARREDDPGEASADEVPDAARAAIAAFAAAASTLALPVDDESAPLLTPVGDEDVDAVDDALVKVSALLAARLAPALAGALPPVLRIAWRDAEWSRAVAVRAPLAESSSELVALASLGEATAAMSGRTASPADAGASDVRAGLARLDVIARQVRDDAADADVVRAAGRAVRRDGPPAPRPPVVDALVELALTRDAIVDAVMVERLGLPDAYLAASPWQRQGHVELRLDDFAPEDVIAAVLDRAEALLDRNDLDRVLTPRLPHAVEHPALLDRVVALWDTALAAGWKGSERLPRLLAPVAHLAPLFVRALDMVASPDDERGSELTAACFGLLAVTTARRDDALAALVARVRADRGDRLVRWRWNSYRALENLAAPGSFATAALELSCEHGPDAGMCLLRLVAADPVRGPGLLERLIDVPGLSVRVARAWVRGPGGAAARERLLAHPWWQVRLEAADNHPTAAGRRAERVAIRRAVEAARLPLSDDERARLKGDSAAVIPRLLPLPSLVEAMTSTCADLRRAALAATDGRRDPEDAAALVWADELDRALQRRGYRRMAPRWGRWRTLAPALVERASRLAWARAQASALPPVLARVRDEGATVVAADWPPPYLGLTDDERAALEDEEQPLAARGAALLSSSEPWGAC